jgi:hypothetical protein
MKLPTISTLMANTPAVVYAPTSGRGLNRPCVEGTTMATRNLPQDCTFANAKAPAHRPVLPGRVPDIPGRLRSCRSGMTFIPELPGLFGSLGSEVTLAPEREFVEFIPLPVVPEAP